MDGEPFSLGLRRDADQALILGEPLGRGAMGVVRVATRKSDGCKFALKTIPKAGPQSLAGQTPTGEAMTIWERKVRDEVSLHFALGASLDIVTLHDGFEDEAGVHLLIDLCDGGDLLSGASVAHSTEDEDNAVVPKNDEDDDEEFTSNSNAAGVNCVGECWTPFSEATAAPMIRGMLRALAACHEHGVVHRDVKPANYLFMRDPDCRNRLKLSDFGLAARISSRRGTLTEQCGTYAYLSPEMARRRPYDFKVDAWAAGVVAYMLLAGEPPFADWDAIREGRSPQKDGLLRNIRRGKPDTAIDDLHLSPGAKSLLHNLLHLDPQKRMSCKEAAEHYWVREKGVASHADALGEFTSILLPMGKLTDVVFCSQRRRLSNGCRRTEPWARSAARPSARRTRPSTPGASTGAPTRWSARWTRLREPRAWSTRTSACRSTRWTRRKTVSFFLFTYGQLE